MRPFTVILVATALLVACFDAHKESDVDSAIEHRAEPTGRSPADEPKGFEDYNVVLIVIDSLRARDLGSYGYSRDTSVFLDSLAAEGVLFTHASSTSSYTRESVAGLLTGRLPSRSGAAGWNAMPLEASDHVAERFQAFGYRTALLSNSIMIRGPGFRRGFDFVEYPSKSQRANPSSDELSDSALRFVRQAPVEKFFLYLHYLDPHSPYRPDPARIATLGGRPYSRPLNVHTDVREHCAELREEGFGPGEARFEDLKLRYDAEIVGTSEAVRRLFEGLQQMDVLERTLVIVTSDHGEEFLEHGYVEHAWTLYQESVHVPLLIWAPELLAPERVDAGASLVDLTPTLHTLFGLGGTDFDGRSLFERADGAWSPVREETARFSELLIQTRNLLHSVTLGEWKYIVAQKWLNDAAREEAVRAKRAGAVPTEDFSYTDPWGPRVREELYNLESDPTESNNLADTELAQLELMRELMRAYRESARSGASFSARPIELSPEELRELEALGYR